MSSIPRVKTEKHFAEHDSVCRSKPSVVLEKGPGPGPALCGKLRCFVLRACAPSSMKDKPDSAALCPDKVKKIKTHEKN